MVPYSGYQHLCRFIGMMKGQKDKQQALLAQIGCHVKRAETCVVYEDEAFVIVCDTKSLAFVCTRKENGNPVLSADEEGTLVRTHGELQHLHTDLLAAACSIIEVLKEKN